MNQNSGLMLELKPSFQNLLFTRLLKDYDRFKLANILKRSPSILYHYKNLRVKSLSLKVVNKAVKLAGVSRKKLKQNTIKYYYAKESIRQILDKGREIQKSKLENWKIDIPKVEELFSGNYLLLEKWFDKYQKMINFGTRQFKSITSDNEKIRLEYTNYSNSKKKTFVNYLPRNIKIDDDFQYFFGLWCGDRIGRGRFGVVNKSKEINFYTEYYLKKLYQKSEYILYYSDQIEKPKVDYNIHGFYKIKSKTKFKGYSIQVGIKNGIMFGFFDYLYNNINQVLNLLPNKNIFFAGLFDAEGNVSLENSCFRWSCLDMKRVEIYKEHLTKLGLFNRYDGCNLIAYDKTIFSTKILPYLRHPDKINRTNLICYKVGKLGREIRFLNILKVVKDKPGMPNSELSKALNRACMYSQIMFLERLGYVERKSYPKQMYITQKGLDAISGSEGLE